MNSLPNTDSRFIRNCAIGLCLAPLLACATQTHAPHHWDTLTQSWHGREAIDLWRSWGVPTKVVEAPNGNEMQVYISNQRSSHSAASFYQGYGATTASSSSTTSCETTFEVKAEKIIIGSIWRGQNCPDSKTEPMPEWMTTRIGF